MSSNNSSPATGENDLLENPLAVINVGLERFHQDLEAAGARSIHVEWTPPAGGDPELADLLAELGG